MHPTIGYQLANALITERHHRAERERAARALQAVRVRAHHPSPQAANHTGRVLVHRALALLGAR